MSERQDERTKALAEVIPELASMDERRSVFASTSVARHLARGAIGFGLIGAALALAVSVGPAALLLAPIGMVALRGCPMCWTVGLIETISAGRLRRTCTNAGCALQVTGPGGDLPRRNLKPSASARRPARRAPGSS
jgi:hypothetical protein